MKARKPKLNGCLILRYERPRLFNVNGGFFKHPETMLVATIYPSEWAKELFAILKERCNRVDRQATQSLVQDFYNITLLSEKVELSL